MRNKNQAFASILQKLWINSSRDLAMRSPVFKQIGTYHPAPTRKKRKIKKQKFKGDFITSSDEEVNETLEKLAGAIDQINEIMLNSPRGPEITPPIPKPRKSLIQQKTDVMITDSVDSVYSVRKYEMVSPLVKPHHQVIQGF